MKKLIYLAVFMLIFVPHLLFAGAWTMPKGTVYQRLSYDYYATDENFGTGGGYDESAEDLDSRYKFISRDITWYGEAGIIDNLTATWSLVSKNMSWSKNKISTDQRLKDSSHSCLGDTEIGVKYSFLNGPTALSTQFIFKSELFYERDETIMPGNNQSDYEFRVLAGRSLWPYGYINLETGYRIRSQAPADEFKYQIEYGIDYKRIYSMVKLRGVLSADNADIPDKTLSGTYKYNPSLGLEYDLGTVEITLGVKLPLHFALEGRFSQDIYGKSIAKGYTMGIGLVHEMSWW